MKLPTLTATGIGLVLCFVSCTPGTDNLSSNTRLTNTDRQAYVPKYISIAETNDFSLYSERITEKAGKIYAYGNYIFQNDQYKGLHIIDNTDRANPKKVAFLSIPYNTEFAIKGGFIYANSLNDLVVIDIRDIKHPVLVKRMENTFPMISQEYPNQSGYFVCPDPGKGTIVEWELQNVESANCRR